MKEIEYLINNHESYSGILVQKKFISKKNTVAYVIFKDKPRILKWFAPGFKKQMEIEFNILSKGNSKLNMPSIYEMDKVNNVLTMNYIPGKNLCDIINNVNESYDVKKKLIIQLASWFKNFHKYFKNNDQFIIRGDSILRNFILTDRIWGLDFEESRVGKVEEDIADMCASIITTNPMFTDEKFGLCRLFIDSYSKSFILNLDGIAGEISYSILHTMMQRGKDFSKKESDAIVEKILLIC